MKAYLDVSHFYSVFSKIYHVLNSKVFSTSNFRFSRASSFLAGGGGSTPLVQQTGIDFFTKLLPEPSMHLAKEDQAFVFWGRANHSLNSVGYNEERPRTDLFRHFLGKIAIKIVKIMRECNKLGMYFFYQVDFLFRKCNVKLFIFHGNFGRSFWVGNLLFHLLLGLIQLS